MNNGEGSYKSFVLRGGALKEFLAGFRIFLAMEETIRMEGKIDKMLKVLEFLQDKASLHHDDLKSAGYEKEATVVLGNNPVCMVKEVATNECFAIKKIPLHEDKVTPAIARELSIMYDVQHHHILRLHHSFVLGKCLCLVLEFAPEGDLDEFIHQKKVITQDRIREWMEQLISAVAYLHNRKIIHRDLKPANIRLTKDGIKVCEFGLSRHFFDGDRLSPQVMTLEYRAPEIFLGCDTYTSAVDMWSIGCIFWELVMQKKLFEFGEMNTEAMIEQIFKKLGSPSELTWPGVTTMLNFPHGIPVYEPQTLEIKAESIAAELSEAGIDMLERLLCYDPEKRIGANDALKHPYFKR